MQTHTLQEVRRVPGTIGYNTARRLEVKMPAGGVVKQVVAKVGQEVKHGDTLAILTSIEVGMARDELVNAEADAALAKKESDWATEIATHLDALLKELDKRPEVSDVEKIFKDQVLGVHRDKVLSAYSKLVLADRTAESTEAVAQDGVISGIIVRERRSARSGGRGVPKYQRTVEVRSPSDSFACSRRAGARRATSRCPAAEAGGPAGALCGNLQSPGDRTICELVLRAPLDGFVEERLVADGAHFVASQTLFVIANTDTLFVSAQIYEREWASLNEANITDVMVESPSVPDRKVAAKMLYVSVGLSHATHAVPLIAECPIPTDDSSPACSPGFRCRSARR